jgi:hypothetical protein
MQPLLVIGVFIAYAALLAVIGRLTAQRGNAGFF